jgi:demethylmenaquinone methyltransferase / 2-methoxy-6-polyprenyl-1,4-benzoquinol methylase
LIKPYNTTSTKKVEVRAMFNSIARNYDFLNHFLSFGIDKFWRRVLINELLKYKPQSVIDIATGTADLAIMAASKGVGEVIGVDLAPMMIDIGKKKISKSRYSYKIDLIIGDAENLSFPTNSFDAAMVAFGVRNFENLERGLDEINRVLKVGAPLLILEFSQPKSFPIKQFYFLYSKYLMPFFGRIISKDKSAYVYLPESIKKFPSGNNFIEILSKSNFENCRLKSLTFGIATLYIGHKLC